MKRFWFSSAILLAASLAHAQDTSWTKNDAMLTYFQAAGAIQEHALQPLDYPDIVHKSLKLLLAQQDPFSTLFTPAEYARYQTAQGNEYSGIGIELGQSKSGRFYCIPYPDSPAARAGIKDRDELELVDGQAVAGQTLEKIGARIRGKAGTPITLVIRAETAEERVVTIERSRIRPQSVHTFLEEGISILRMFTFTSSTPGELRSAILSLPGDAPIVIDLRGCPGGNLFDAVDAAKLFLAPGQTIVEVQRRTGNTTYQSERPATFPARPLWILQDEGTASAAEVFIAAMVDNGRGQSIGKTSFGKGRTQRIIELMDGSAIFLTDAELLSPSGHTFNGQGIRPTFPTKEDAAITQLLNKLQP